MRFCSSVFAALALVASHAGADVGDPAASTIRVIGEATVTSRPDRVEIDLGVVTRGASAQQAVSENARVLQNVIIALRKALGAKAIIETMSYTLQPNYQSTQQGGEPKITGYTASNLVRVIQDDLTTVATVIDTAVRAGANQIDRIRFMLKDEAAAKSNALRAAALEARTKASSLANALGLQVIRIHWAEEASATPRPLFDLRLQAAGATTPILPGAIETTATVTLSVEFASHR